MRCLKKKFTLVELLVVISIIGILTSMLLPSLSMAREKAMFALCINNRDQNYKLIAVSLDDNTERLPNFLNSHLDNPDNPTYENHDWAGTRKRATAEIVNPVASSYIDSFAQSMKCPSLAKGELKDEVNSNGTFDYSFIAAFSGIMISNLEIYGVWKGQELPTPMVGEEDPKFNINRNNHESSWATGDSLGSWHDFGKKGGYLSIAGHSVVVYSKGLRYSAGAFELDYMGETKTIGNHDSLESWPR